MSVVASFDAICHGHEDGIPRPVDAVRDERRPDGDVTMLGLGR